jgi:hypothetical protein
LNCHKKHTMNIVNSSTHHDAMCLALKLELANNVTLQPWFYKCFDNCAFYILFGMNDMLHC